MLLFMVLWFTFAYLPIAHMVWFWGAGSNLEANAFAGTAKQVGSQLWGVITTVIWSGLVSFLAFKLVDITVGLRASEEAER